MLESINTTDTPSFISELDELYKVGHTEILTMRKTMKTQFLSYTYQVDIPEEFLTKYELNSFCEFDCTISAESGGVSVHYYKGRKIKPDGHYIQKQNDTRVGLLQILQECVKQDTHQPDIKFLQRGEK